MPDLVVAFLLLGFLNFQFQAKVAAYLARWPFLVAAPFVIVRTRGSPCCQLLTWESKMIFPSPTPLPHGFDGIAALYTINTHFPLG